VTTREATIIDQQYAMDLALDLDAVKRPVFVIKFTGS